MIIVGKLERSELNISRFIDRPNERTLVNKYVDAHMDGMNRYSKYIDSTPSFVTYYSRDGNKSMENPGLGTVKEVVGYESPNRYNRIENMPLFAVEEIRPEVAYDGISGITSETEFTAVIIPDTLIPNVDDLLVFSYHETESDDNYRLYRVTNIELSNMDSNSYYRVSLISTPYDKEILDARQLVDDYNLIYNNIGANESTVLLQSTFIKARELELIYETLLNGYIGNYFNSELGSFIFYNGSVHVYSSDVHAFIQGHGDLLINSKTIMKNIKLTNYVKKKYNERPHLLFYKYLEDIERHDKIHYPERYKLHENIIFSTNILRNSTFNILPQKYIDIDKKLFDKNEDMYSFFNNIDIFSNPLTVSSSFADIRDEAILALNERTDSDHTSDELRLMYYSTIEDKMVTHELLFKRLEEKYLVRDSASVPNIYIGDSLPSNYLPDIIAYIMKVIHVDGKKVLYTSDKSDELLKYIDEAIHDISDYSLNNYYYIPILLYFVKDFIDSLVNNQ